MAKGNRKRARKAMRVLEGADADFETLAELSANIVDSQVEFVRALTEMQEMQLSFNLQILRLQQATQAESRRFTVLSTLMRTKHDMVKNTLNNIR